MSEKVIWIQSNSVLLQTLCLHFRIHSTLPPLPLSSAWCAVSSAFIRAQTLPRWGWGYTTLLISTTKHKRIMFSGVCKVVFLLWHGFGFLSSKHALPFLNSHTANLLILHWVKFPEMVCLTRRTGKENQPLISKASVSTVCDHYFLGYFQGEALTPTSRECHRSVSISARNHIILNS